MSKENVATASEYTDLIEEIKLTSQRSSELSKSKSLIEEKIVSQCIELLSTIPLHLMLEVIQKSVEAQVVKENVHHYLSNGIQVMPNIDELVALYTVISDRSTSFPTEHFKKVPLYEKYKLERSGSNE